MTERINQDPMFLSLLACCISWFSVIVLSLMNLHRAEEQGFDVMVTCERNLRYQQNLAGRNIAIVVRPAGRWPLVRDQIEKVVHAIDGARPGTYRETFTHPTHPARSAAA